MTGAPEGSPKVVLCGFMEKPGIEPATPGLQGIALIHYTTGASHLYVKTKKVCRCFASFSSEQEHLHMVCT